MPQTQSQWLATEGAKLARWVAKQEEKIGGPLAALQLEMKVVVKYHDRTPEERQQIVGAATARINHNARIKANGDAIYGNR